MHNLRIVVERETTSSDLKSSAFSPFFSLSRKLAISEETKGVPEAIASSIVIAKDPRKELMDLVEGYK